MHFGAERQPARLEALIAARNDFPFNHIDRGAMRCRLGRARRADRQTDRFRASRFAHAPRPPKALRPAWLVPPTRLHRQPAVLGPRPKTAGRVERADSAGSGGLSVISPRLGPRPVWSWAQHALPSHYAAPTFVHHRHPPAGQTAHQPADSSKWVPARLRHLSREKRGRSRTEKGFFNLPSPPLPTHTHPAGM